VTRSQPAGTQPFSAPARSVDSRTDDRTSEHLRVLIANERTDRLALVAPIVVALGHEVVAREVDVKDVGAVTAGNDLTLRLLDSVRAQNMRSD